MTTDIAIRTASILAARDYVDAQTAAMLRIVAPSLAQVSAVLQGTDEQVMGATAEVIGVVYRDDGTRQWYAADLSDLAMLAGRIADGERDAYSLWASDTSAQEYATEADAAASLA